jgi:hypothetical protein
MIPNNANDSYYIITIKPMTGLGLQNEQSPSFSCRRKRLKIFQKFLVGGIPTPLKNDGVRQLG